MQTFLSRSEKRSGFLCTFTFFLYIPQNRISMFCYRKSCECQPKFFSKPPKIYRALTLVYFEFKMSNEAGRFSSSGRLLPEEIKPQIKISRRKIHGKNEEAQKLSRDCRARNVRGARRNRSLRQLRCDNGKCRIGRRCGDKVRKEVSHCLRDLPRRAGRSTRR